MAETVPCPANWTENQKHHICRKGNHADRRGFFAVFEQKTVQTGSTDLTTFDEENIAGSANAYADNRTILFYYPTVNGSWGDSYFGNTHVYRRSNGDLCWGYDDTNGNGVFLANKG